MLAKLKALYLSSPGFQRTVQAIEGGLALGFITATANGFDLSKKGLTALVVGMAGGAGIALRNLLIQETK